MKKSEEIPLFVFVSQSVLKVFIEPGIVSRYFQQF